MLVHGKRHIDTANAACLAEKFEFDTGSDTPAGLLCRELAERSRCICCPAIFIADALAVQPGSLESLTGHAFALARRARIRVRRLPADRDVPCW
jgi:hypothetical protein